MIMYYRRAMQFILRNRIILDNTWRKPRKQKVNLHWWMIPPTNNLPSQYNIGDYLSTVVVEWMKEQHKIESDASYDGKTHHLYAIGSILTTGFQNATIWGSGTLHFHHFWWKKSRKLDVRCVRGPITRATLLINGYSCPEIYGDPAILMPLIYSPDPHTEKTEYIVIPNHSVDAGNDRELSTITKDYKTFINRIVQAKLVISSSLHGIILAEAYGVPAILLTTDTISLLKYRDWYESTGRNEFPMASSIDDALNITPPPIPDLSIMQKNIINAFPADLWARNA